MHGRAMKAYTGFKTANNNVFGTIASGNCYLSLHHSEE